MQELVALKDFKFGGIMIRRDMVIHMSGENARFYTAVGAVGPRDADGSGRIMRGQPVFDPRPKPAPKRKAPRKRPAKKAK